MKKIPRGAGACAAALVLVLAACGTGSTAGPPADATVTGVLTLGPQCPVETVDEPCPDVPTTGTVAARDRTSGEVIAEASSDDDGTYHLEVPAGAYVLEATAERAMSCAPVDVDVASGTIEEADIPCDTGIR